MIDMPGITTAPETGGLKGKVYLDESGGYIMIAVSSGNYTRYHKFHINAFGASTPSGYNTSTGSQETNVVQTAENLVALMQPIYPTSTSIAALGAWQVQSDHQTVLPVAIDLSAAVGVGTGTSGTNVVTMTTFTAHGSDFTRWTASFHGTSSDAFSVGGRYLLASHPNTHLQALGNYLMGLAAGPGIGGSGAGLTTQVVTHSGTPIIQPMYLVFSLSKRIRRRFRQL